MLTIFPKMHLIKISRVKKGMSIRQLAKNAGINPVTISKIENGLSKPNPSTASKICVALDTDFDQLFEIIDVKKGA